MTSFVGQNCLPIFSSVQGLGEFPRVSLAMVSRDWGALLHRFLYFNFEMGECLILPYCLFCHFEINDFFSFKKKKLVYIHWDADTYS